MIPQEEGAKKIERQQRTATRKTNLFDNNEEVETRRLEAGASDAAQTVHC